MILNKWSTEDLDNKIIEFSWKILEVFKTSENDPSKVLAILRILIDRLFAVTDNKPNPLAFKFYTGILENLNRKYPLMKELMISNIFSKNKGIALLVGSRKDYKSLKEYYKDRGFKFSKAEDGSEARETIEKLFSERLSRYLEFMTHICNSNINFYQPFLWKYIQATIKAPINEFTPLIIKVILEHCSQNLMKAYGDKFKQILIYLKTDYNEWERKMLGTNDNPSKHNDFVAKMFFYADNDLKKINNEDCSIMKQQIDQIEK